MGPPERIAILAVYAALLGSALALGAAGGWPLAGTHLVVVVAVAAWAFLAFRARRLEWRPNSLDLPVALLLGVVVVQLVLGNHPLASWALGAPVAPATERFPSPQLLFGSVSPGQTIRALLQLRQALLRPTGFVQPHRVDRLGDVRHSGVQLVHRLVEGLPVLDAFEHRELRQIDEIGLVDEGGAAAEEHLSIGEHDVVITVAVEVGGRDGLADPAVVSDAEAG